MSEKPHRKAVVCLPKTSDGKLILCRRAKEKFPFPDVWVCAVGGGVEENETHEEAMMREIKEEIGIIAEVEKISEVIYDSDERSEHLTIFTTKTPLDKNHFSPDEREIQYLENFSAEEIKKMIDENPDEFAPTFREVFREFASKIKS